MLYYFLSSCWKCSLLLIWVCDPLWKFSPWSILQCVWPGKFALFRGLDKGPAALGVGLVFDTLRTHRRLTSFVMSIIAIVSRIRYLHFHHVSCHYKFEQCAWPPICANSASNNGTVVRQGQLCVSETVWGF